MSLDCTPRTLTTFRLMPISMSVFCTSIIVFLVISVYDFILLYVIYHILLMIYVLEIKLCIGFKFNDESNKSFGFSLI